MATQPQKVNPQPAATVARTRSPAFRWILTASLAANAVLGGLLLVRSGAPQQPSKEPVLAAALPGSGSPPPSPPAHTPPPETPLPPELAAYAALGTYLAENNHIPALRWTEPQFKAFEEGVRASYAGHGYPVNDEAIRLRDEISAKVRLMVDPTPSDPIEDYFKTLREKEGVQRTSTGLHFRITQEGSGKMPGPDATVVASYGARLPNGTPVPNLTRARSRSAVRDLLPGLGEGIQMIAPGGKILIYLPPALSFRDGPWPAEVPKGSPIIFFIELHEVIEN